MKTLPVEFRHRVVALTDEGSSAVEIAEALGVSAAWVRCLYVKRTDVQRVTAARRRRAWVDTERNGDKSQNGGDVAASE